MNNIHKNIEDLIEAYLDNQLSPENKSELKNHILDCSDCQTKFNDSILIHEELAMYMKEEAPSALFLNDLIEGVNKRLSLKKFNWFFNIFSLSALKPVLILGSIALVVYAGYVQEHGVKGVRSEEVSKQPIDNPASLEVLDNKSEPESDKSSLETSETVIMYDQRGRAHSEKVIRNPILSGGRAGGKAGEDRDEAPSSKNIPWESKTEELELGNAISDKVGSGGRPRASDKSPGATGQENAQSEQQSLDRKIIKTGYVDVETKSFEETHKEVKMLANKYEGYVSDVSTVTKQNGKIQGTITIKIPAKFFDETIDAVKKMGKLLNIRVTTQDVTKHYVDIQSKLKTLRVMQERLTELLKLQKSKLVDLLEVEKELGRVNGEIDKIEGEIRYYDTVTSFSTLFITVKEEGIDAPAVVIQTTAGYINARVDNVQGSFTQLNKYCELNKIQVKEASLQEQSTPENTNAKLQIVFSADKVVSVIKDIENQKITIESQQIQKRQHTDQKPVPEANELEIKKEEAVLDIYLYHFQKREVGQGQITVRVVDVVKTYTSLEAKLIKDFGAEVSYSKLNEGQYEQKTGTITISVMSDKVTAVADHIKSLGEVTYIDINQYPPQGEMTKLVKQLVKLTINIVPPQGRYELRQSANFQVKADDPKDALNKIREIAAQNNCRVLSTNFASDKDKSNINIQLQSPADAFLNTTNQLAQVGEAQKNIIQTQQEVGTDPTSSLKPTTIEMPATITVEIKDKGKFVSSEEGFFATLQKTLKNSFTGLLNSIRYLFTGIAIILPFALALALLYFLVLRKYLNGKKAS